jgi:hypothetical protein
VNNTNYSHRHGIEILNGLYSRTRIPISGAFDAELVNDDGTIQKVIYYSINHLFYKRKNNPSETFGDTDPRRIDKMLYESCSIISIPQKIYGEALREKSIDISSNLIVSASGISFWYIADDFEVGGSGSFHLKVGIKDDGNGNIYDTAIDSGSFIPYGHLVGYWGFNEKFKEYGQGILSSGKIEDRSSLNHTTIFKNVKFEPGIKTDGIVSASSGTWASFDGLGYAYIKNSDDINFKVDQNFAISLWLDIDAQDTCSVDFNYIISKEGEVEEEQHSGNAGAIATTVISFDDVKYPYAIKVYNDNTTNSGKLWVGRNDGRKESFVTSSIFITGSQHHIVFQKSGSQLQLYIDGVLDNTTVDNTTLNTHNNSYVYFGSKNNRNITFGVETGLSGSIDEIRFINKALSLNEIVSLSDNDFELGTAYNTARIGNVFYKHGIIVLSDLRPKYKSLFVINDGIDFWKIENNFIVE